MPIGLIIVVAILVVVLIGFIIFSATSYKRFVKTYYKYQNENVASGYTGEDVVVLIDEKYNLNLDIYYTNQVLADSYYPFKNKLLLSKQTLTTSSVSSVAIAAHELGHAIQKKRKNLFFILSNILIVLYRITSFLFFPALIAGIVLLIIPNYLNIGIIVIVSALSTLLLTHVIKLITIPIEYNASKIAYNFLEENYILNQNELKHAKKLFSMAGQTYIASLSSGIVKFIKNFLYVIS